LSPSAATFEASSSGGQSSRTPKRLPVSMRSLTGRPLTPPGLDCGARGQSADARQDSGCRAHAREAGAITAARHPATRAVRSASRAAPAVSLRARPWTSPECAKSQLMRGRTEMSTARDTPPESADPARDRSRADAAPASGRPSDRQPALPRRDRSQARGRKARVERRRRANPPTSEVSTSSSAARPGRSPVSPPPKVPHRPHLRLRRARLRTADRPAGARRDDRRHRLDDCADLRCGGLEQLEDRVAR
jgi:hypothetical protein